MVTSVLAICAGASAGALLRWAFSSLNVLFPFLPPGTLLVNVLGSYCAGLLVSLFALYPGMLQEWRLLGMTGFLGAFTTFSAFSVEVALLVQSGRFLWAAAAISAHVLGSLSATLLGMGTVAFLRRLG